jgi:hypothetical protein
MNFHDSDVRQALEFLRSHRDTIVILLKADNDNLSASVLEEMRLLVSLGSIILSSVPKTELVSDNGYHHQETGYIIIFYRSQRVDTVLFIPQ